MERAQRRLTREFQQEMVGVVAAVQAVEVVQEDVTVLVEARAVVAVGEEETDNVKNY